MPYISLKKKNRKSKRPLSESVKISTVALSFVSILFLSFASLAYLSHKNLNATKAYKLKDLEREHRILLDEGENQGVKLAKMKSLKLILEDEFISNMPPARNPMYIRADTALAQK